MNATPAQDQPATGIRPVGASSSDSPNLPPAEGNTNVTTPDNSASNANTVRTQDHIGEAFREQVLGAGYDLLSDLGDITYHQSADGLEFSATHYGLVGVVEELQSLAERVQAIGQAAAESLTKAVNRRGWALAGRVRWCANCGESIAVAGDDWQICRDLPEHTWCHLDEATPEDEDRDRASVISEAEDLAYCEDRIRAGGPRHGDSVELTFLDGRQVQGTWFVPGPPPLGAPIVLDWSNDAEVSLGGAQVQVIGVGDDVGAWVSSLEDLARGEELRAELAALARATRRWELPDDCGEMPDDYVTVMVEELRQLGVDVLDSHESGVQLTVPGWLADDEEGWAGWGIDPTELAVTICGERSPDPKVYAYTRADRSDPWAVAAALAAALPDPVQS